MVRLRALPQTQLCRREKKRQTDGIKEAIMAPRIFHLSSSSRARFGCYKHVLSFTLLCEEDLHDCSKEHSSNEADKASKPPFPSSRGCHHHSTTSQRANGIKIPKPSREARQHAPDKEQATSTLSFGGRVLGRPSIMVCCLMITDVKGLYAEDGVFVVIPRRSKLDAMEHRNFLFGMEKIRRRLKFATSSARR
ncbi:hypothetical protein B296_00026815 [Ensete ventricosum]|uniref:Uncharacterized protein n=1 Tax=Ensete ventricosum TaxID=4639 RepID=A0A426YPL2_ENSVE|nr:hypothetical protein B296_00026815 [Ensete ventricosum]